MGERVKELAEQSDIFADEKLQMPGEYHPDWHDIRDQKFAELIIHEVAKLISDEKISNYYLDRESYNDTLDTLLSRIEDHFKVKL